MPNHKTNGRESNPIGARLREIRQQRQLTLRGLAQTVGVTASLLSQIENGVVNPSVDTLLTLADDLGLPVSYFFSEGPESSEETVTSAHSPQASRYVVDKLGRNRLRLNGGIVWESLLPHEEPNLEWMITNHPTGAGTTSTMLQHNGREYGLVLSGELRIKLGFIDHRLQVGDSIAFDGTTPHWVRNEGLEPAQAIWMILDRDVVHPVPGGSEKQSDVSGSPPMNALEPNPRHQDRMA